MSSIFLAAAMLLACLLAGCGREQQEEISPTTTPDETAAPTVTPDPYESMIQVYDGYGGLMWVPEADALTPFSMDRSAFSVDGNIASYSGEGYNLLLGVDVSEHQGSIDWQAVADAGFQFAIIRCGWRGYSGGSLNEDTWFQENLTGAQKAGLETGVYFFSQAISVEEAAQEAELVLELLDGCTLDLPVFFDWEEITADEARTDNMDGETLTAACLEFCRIVSEAGYQAGLYAYLNLAYFTYDLNALQDIPLWMGDPGSFPEFYYDHMCWQYSFSGSIAGIDGDVDLDAIYELMNGEKQEAAG